MRKILLFILFLSLVTVACAQQQNNTDNNGDTNSTQETAEQEAPRIEVTATPTLPPTYTAAPFGQGGHIAPVEGRTTHIVQAGETMGQIAAKYGVGTKFLADSNRIYNYHLIRVGQILYIPDCE